jgi:hypothetical protein
MGRRMRIIAPAMNTTKRFLFGFLSSALLAVGLARAADILDPMSRSLPAAQSKTGTKSTADCVYGCDVPLLNAPNSIYNCEPLAVNAAATRNDGAANR